jgi:hypothetical protein
MRCILKKLGDCREKGNKVQWAFQTFHCALERSFCHPKARKMMRAFLCESMTLPGKKFSPHDLTLSFPTPLSMPFRTSKEELEKELSNVEEELLKLEVDRDILKHRIRMRQAEENVREEGCEGDEDDFNIAVEEEEKRLWEEEIRPERERFEERMYREMELEEARKEEMQETGALSLREGRGQGEGLSDKQ